MQPYEKYLKENSQKLRVDQTDAERKLWQRINRFTVMRFSNDEVMSEIESVVEQIYLFLENVRAD
ncbi:MAG: DUF559 domain-containing protein [Haemophilus parainfluenzae]|nr:DUF559 domain-containing protein [Haemophilus parainfluenzae]